MFDILENVEKKNMGFKRTLLIIKFKKEAYYE